MKPQKRYWDSCCFLGYLKGEEDKERACKAVLKEAKKGNVIIVTSALTLAEVIKLRRKDPILKDDASLLKNAFQQDYIRVQNLDSYIAELARRVAWEHGFKPWDSIHVATAMRHKIVIFDTFDGDLLKLDKPLGNPPMRIGKPDILYQAELFSETDTGQGDED